MKISDKLHPYTPDYIRTEQPQDTDYEVIVGEPENNTDDLLDYLLKNNITERLRQSESKEEFEKELAECLQWARSQFNEISDSALNNKLGFDGTLEGYLFEYDSYQDLVERHKKAFSTLLNLAIANATEESKISGSEIRDIVGNKMSEIKNQAEDLCPLPEKLPRLESRITQLLDLYNSAKALSGLEMKLVPIPYEYIKNKVVPAYSLGDKSPKDNICETFGLSDYYFDYRLAEVFAGRVGTTPPRYVNTYYSNVIDKYSMTFDDFGLVLMPKGQLDGSDMSHFIDIQDVRDFDNARNDEMPKLGNGDFVQGFCWAMHVIDKIKKRNIELNEPLKMVLPYYLPNRSDFNYILASIYKCDNGGIGLAFDSITKSDALKFECLTSVATRI